MKTRNILISVALPALFAACADNDLVSSPSVETQDGNLVKLEKGFALAFTRGEGTATRTAWQLEGWGKTLYYSWLPDLNGTTIIPEDIGLAWRGEVENAEVKTNYKFTLDGYLKKGETTPKFRDCGNGLLITNGYKFGTATATDISLNEYNAANHDMNKVSNYKLVLNNSTSKGEWELHTVSPSQKVTYDIYDADALADESPDVMRGVFTTTNSTVFAGKYIVYFPYNPSFAETGHLPATSPAEFTMNTDLTGNLAAHLTGKTFAYGKAEIKTGGVMAENFSTTNLSAVIALNLINNTEANVKISQVILHDEENEKGFYTSVGLDAGKIDAGAEGQDLYVIDDKTTYSPTLRLKLESGSGANKYVELNTTSKKEQLAVLAALPVNLVKPVVYVMFENGMSVKKALAAATLVGGKIEAWNVRLEKDDMKAENQMMVAVDNRSFLRAWDNAWNAAGSDDKTIVTLGNITFNGVDSVMTGTSGRVTSFNLDATAGQANGLMFQRNITIKGKGTLTVPADVTCWFKGYGDKNNEAPTLTIENPIVIESEGCCGTAPGRLVLGNANIRGGSNKGKGNHVIKSDLTNSGLLIVGPNNGEGTFTFEGRIINNHDTKYESKPGEVDFCGAKGNEIVVNGKIENNGIVELKDSVYNVPNAEWGAFNTGGTSDPEGVSVKANGGIDNKTEASRLKVGYLSKLSLGGSSVNNGEIEIIAKGSGNDQSVDGTLVVEQGASLTNNKQIHNKGVFTNDNGTVTLNAGSEFVDFVGSQYSGVKADLRQDAEYICEVDDARKSAGDRLAYALENNMSTTVVRFVESKDAGAVYTWNLEDYSRYDAEGKKLQRVKFEFNGDKVFTINSVNNSGNAVAHNFGTGVTVLKADSVKFGKGYITINGNLEGKRNKDKVEAGQTTVIAVIAQKGSAAFEIDTPDLTVKENVNLEELVKLHVTQNGRVDICQRRTDRSLVPDKGNLTIGKGAIAEFQYSSYTEVGDELSIDGKFTRILSSGVSTANPAKVWCESYSKGGNAEITNGLPETR